MTNPFKLLLRAKKTLIFAGDYDNMNLDSIRFETVPFSSFLLYRKLLGNSRE